jgi:DNA-binding PadR family transcriptional regulator
MAKRNPEQEARRSSLIALFCLYEQDLSGYQLRKTLKNWHITNMLPISPSTIYRSLDRLEQEGALSSRLQKNGNYPESKVYGITAKGRKLYRKLLREEAVFAYSSHALSTFVGLATFLSGDERVALVKEWQQAARDAIGELQARIDDHSEGGTYGKPFAEWLLYDHEKHILDAEVAWLEKYQDMTGGDV